MTQAPDPTPINPHAIRKGDEVSVRAWVVDPPSGGYTIVTLNPSSKNRSCDLQVLTTSIVTHTPRPQPLLVGDTVRLGKLGLHKGEIMAICDGRAWVKWITVDLSPFGTYDLSNLERAL